MINVKKTEDIYPAVEELIKILAQNNNQHYSNVLNHRMYKVSWTSQDELFEELQKVLNNLINGDQKGLDSCIINQVKDILQHIDKSL